MNARLAKAGAATTSVTSGSLTTPIPPVSVRNYLTSEVTGESTRYRGLHSCGLSHHRHSQGCQKKRFRDTMKASLKAFDQHQPRRLGAGCSGQSWMSFGYSQQSKGKRKIAVKPGKSGPVYPLLPSPSPVHTARKPSPQGLIGQATYATTEPNYS